MHKGLKPSKNSSLNEVSICVSQYGSRRSRQMQLEVLRHCVAMATAGQEISGENQESEEYSFPKKCQRQMVFITLRLHREGLCLQ